MSRSLVLVGFAESLAAVESVWNLLDHGFEVVAFAREGRTRLIAHDRRVTVVGITAPEDDLGVSAEQVASLAASRVSRC